MSDPELESEPESESIRSPESESEQRHHDSAPLLLPLCYMSVVRAVGEESSKEQCG